VTLLVSQVEISPLNNSAPLNIKDMSMTLPVSQELEFKSLLKLFA